ncbi:MAG: hypothetical protein HQ575_05190 [Candidatus Omnitrophica bacterium]|nr:hypothetical protein [Candidatus Omnitrophota bacterium]
MKPNDYIGKGSEYIANELVRHRGTPLSPEFILLQEYLKLELNKELIESQKKYQDDTVRQMRNLVYATYALVVVTLLVILLKH